MQVNMLEAKRQPGRLVKAALAGKEVIIGSHSKAKMKLVTCVAAAGLTRPGALDDGSPALAPDQLNTAFSTAVGQKVVLRLTR